MENGELQTSVANTGTDTSSDLRDYLTTVIGAVVLAVLVMVFVARAFTVDGPSMLPTLHTGERLLVDKITYHMRTPVRGDVVVFRFPADQSQYFIKRVIGEPGDLVFITQGKVYVNSEPLTELYTAAPALGDFGPYLVPPDSYFVLGDNRNNSEDSRSSRVGFVPRRLIIGRALWRYWPLTRIGALSGQSLAHASP